MKEYRKEVPYIRYKVVRPGPINSLLRAISAMYWPGDVTLKQDPIIQMMYDIPLKLCAVCLPPSVQ